MEGTSDRNRIQSNLLIDTLQPYLETRAIEAYVGGNNSLYYQQTKPPRFVNPAVYVILQQSSHPRPCYVAWEEKNRLPDVIIEMTSLETEHEERGRKLIIYRDVFRTAEYFIYDPELLRLSGFRLSDGDYVSITPGPAGELYSQKLQLNLRVDGSWLRWFDGDGTKLCSGAELARQQMALAEQQRRRAEEAERKLAEALAEIARLRGQH